MNSRFSRLMRAATALSLCACMVFGTVVLSSDEAAAQTDDAIFRGNVTIAGHGAAADTLVMYSMDGQDTPSGNSTVTDSSGDYELWVEGGHDYTLYFANGLALFDMSAMQEQTIYSGETLVVDATLNPASPATATISGQVYNASNPSDPVTTGHVLGLHFMGGDESPDYINWTVTDVDGYYEMGILDGNVMIAVFDADGYHPGMSNPAMVPPGGSATLDLALYDITFSDVTVSGVVSDDDVGGPVEGAQVDARLEDSPIWYRDITASDGTYEILMMHGEGDMMVSADGYVSQREYDLVFSGEMTVDWALRQTDATVYGYVLDSVTLEPIEDARVEASLWMGQNRSMFNQTTSDVDGYFEMDVCDGAWMVGARAPGYGDDWETATVSPSEMVYVELLLEPVSSVVKGFVEDGASDTGIPGATVVLMDEYENRYMTGTNASGYYEINCTSGEYQLIFTASGYMLEMQQDYDTEIGVDDVVWVNHTMDAATTRLYGDVLDAASLDPLDEVEVSTGSVSPYDPEFVRMAFTYSSGGAYSVMVVPADGQIMSAHLSGYDEYFALFQVPDLEDVEHDIYMVPGGGVSTTYTLTGYVNASVSDTPIAGAQVAAVIGLWTTLNETTTDSTGFYSFEVPTMVFTLRVAATGYLMQERLLMPQPPGSVAKEDFWLVTHTVPPTIEVVVDPDDNVSTANHADIHATVVEDYLFMMGLETLRTIRVSNDGGTAYMEQMESLNFMPTMPWNSLQGGEISPGVWEVGLWDWPATARDSVHMIKDTTTGQGFFVDSDSDYYWVDDWDGTIHVQGWYSNSTTGPGFVANAVFYLDGALVGIDLGSGVDPSATTDETGRFWRESRVYTVNLSALIIQGEEWEAVTKVVTPTMYLDLESAPVYPSGDYAAMFWAVDEAILYNRSLSLFTIDNSPPAADAGGDKTAVVNTPVELNASLSWDNVGIVEYMWTFEDGGAQTVYGEIVDYEFTTVGDHMVTLTVTDGALLTGTDTLMVEVLADQAPVADAGPDQEEDEDVEVTLNGTLSSDDVGIVEWTWTFEDGGPQTLNGEIAHWTFDTPGTYTVTLIVTDTIGQDSDPDEAVITVADVTAPTADAGVNRTVTAGVQTTLSGAASSDNVDVVNWTWTFDDEGAQTLYGETATYTFWNLGEVVITLTVRDDAGNSDTDTVTITVIDDADPVADAGPDQDVDAGDEVTLDGSGSSDNVGVVNWTWTFNDGVARTLYGESKTYVFADEGTFTVTLTVRDAAGNSDTDQVVIRVASVNEPPTADAGDDAEIEKGETYTFDGTGSSDDGGLADLNFTWTFVYDGEETKIYGATPEFEFDIADEYTVNLTVTDEQGLTDWDTMVLTVEEKGGVSLMLWAAIGAVVVVAVLLAAYMVMRRGKGVSPPGGEEAEEFEEPGPPEDEEL